MDIHVDSCERTAVEACIIVHALAVVGHWHVRSQGLQAGLCLKEGRCKVGMGSAQNEAFT